jgi:peptidoglycan/xylan/chitin deacetylase (PgdA/CDA1 family)
LAQNLSIGVVNRGSTHDEVVLEMLDHQGICYETIDARRPINASYPLLLISQRSDKVLSQNWLRSVPKEDIIAAADVVDLDGVLECLSGSSNDTGDRLELLVNQEELKLSAAVKNGLKRKGLPFVMKQFWPDNASACCVLTHDLDWFRYSPFHKAVFQVKSSLPRKSKVLIDSTLRGKDYGWNIPSILKLEKKYGAKSTFLFQTDYGTDNSFVDPSLKLMKAEGCEVGLHAAHSSHKDEAALRSEINAFNSRMGSSPHGIRYHILKFRVPDSWTMQSAMGLLYDATFSHTDFFGFRGGVCFPYHPIAGGRLTVTELPTGFMDWTALKRKVRGGRMRNILDEIMSKTVAYHGVVVVNFHNTYLNKDTFPDVLETYEWLLVEASKKGLWMATAQQCVEWWNHRASCRPQVELEKGKIIRAKSQVPLVVDGDDQRFNLRVVN